MAAKKKDKSTNADIAANTGDEEALETQGSESASDASAQATVNEVVINETHASQSVESEVTVSNTEDVPSEDAPSEEVPVVDAEMISMEADTEAAPEVAPEAAAVDTADEDNFYMTDYTPTMVGAPDEIMMEGPEGLQALSADMITMPEHAPEGEQLVHRVEKTILETTTTTTTSNEADTGDSPAEQLISAASSAANSATNGAATGATETAANLQGNIMSETRTTQEIHLNGATPKPEFRLKPSGDWPPPVFVRPNASEDERFYIEYRWYSQWQWYDKRASHAKKWHQRLQIIIGIGSVTVPVLVGFNMGDSTVQTGLQLTTMAIGLAVAIAAAIENVNKYGDDWRTFRAAAEELTREKTMYDVLSGPYRRAKNPFLLFTERCEDIIAKQNGNWLKSSEEQEGRGEKKDETKVEQRFTSYSEYDSTTYSESNLDSASSNGTSDTYQSLPQQTAPPTSVG